MLEFASVQLASLWTFRRRSKRNVHSTMFEMEQSSFAKNECQNSKHMRKRWGKRSVKNSSFFSLPVLPRPQIFVSDFCLGLDPVWCTSRRKWLTDDAEGQRFSSCCRIRKICWLSCPTLLNMFSVILNFSYSRGMFPRTSRTTVLHVRCEDNEKKENCVSESSGSIALTRSQIDELAGMIPISSTRCNSNKTRIDKLWLILST